MDEKLEVLFELNKLNTFPRLFADFRLIVDVIEAEEAELMLEIEL